MKILLKYIYQFFKSIYDIVLSKLKHYCKQQNALQLLSSYLNDGSQHVQLDNIISIPHAVTCRIPQGSVLDLLLFNFI